MDDKKVKDLWPPKKGRPQGPYMVFNWPELVKLIPHLNTFTMKEFNSVTLQDILNILEATTMTAGESKYIFFQMLGSQSGLYFVFKKILTNHNGL